MVSLIKSMMLLEKSIAWPRNRYIYYLCRLKPTSVGFLLSGVLINGRANLASRNNY